MALVWGGTRPWHSLEALSYRPPIRRGKLTSKQTSRGSVVAGTNHETRPHTALHGAEEKSADSLESILLSNGQSPFIPPSMVCASPQKTIFTDGLLSANQLTCSSRSLRGFVALCRRGPAPESCEDSKMRCNIASCLLQHDFSPLRGPNIQMRAYPSNSRMQPYPLT